LAPGLATTGEGIEETSRRGAACGVSAGGSLGGVARAFSAGALSGLVLSGVVDCGGGSGFGACLAASSVARASPTGLGFDDEVSGAGVGGAVLEGAEVEGDVEEGDVMDCAGLGDDCA